MVYVKYVIREMVQKTWVIRDLNENGPWFVIHHSESAFQRVVTKL